jgi:hypothetical protein
MDDLRKGVGEWVEYLRSSTQAATEYVWEGDFSKHIWEVIRRAAIRRQYEALEATLKMVDSGQGHFSILLLRPAYEEFIWIAYLSKYPEIAQRLTMLLAQHDTTSSLVAQNEYVGTRIMSELGFTQRVIKAQEAIDRGVQAQIREIGRSLKWPQRSNLLPSVAFLSRQVNREKEYKFLYHATSKFVHFSTSELARRVWGKHGRVTIGSGSFSNYWSSFSMYWALWLFIHLMVECHDILGPFDADEAKHKEMLEWLRRFEAVPIITRQELEAWSIP